MGAIDFDGNQVLQKTNSKGEPMLPIRKNFMETIKGGKPDRFVAQYEYLNLIPDPILLNCAGMCEPGETLVKDWGFTVTWPQGTPGPFPIHTEDKILLKDITKWKETLKAPDPRKYTAEQWAPFEGMAAATNREQQFCTAFVATGIFEKLHFFMGMEDALINFYEEPEYMHELIDFLADWEIECAKVTIEHLHPDALFHHDDWGSQRSTFLSPEMFNEFITPAYKKIYAFWKANGVEIVIHHSDSYAATLVPSMIEMGVDVWQGAVSDNNIPQLLKEYGEKISIQGGLDNGKFDIENWSKEEIHNAFDAFFKEAGIKYIIPALTMGGPGSVYPGVYEAVNEEIDTFSEIYFPESN